MKIKVIITLKYGVLDPLGQAIQKTLNGMGFSDVDNVRQGKYFEIELNEPNKDKAKEIVEEISKKLLTNIVIEDYTVSFK